MKAGYDILNRERKPFYVLCVCYNNRVKTQLFSYPYATSDRLISFTLEEDTDNIFVKCEKCSIEWCGLDVTLPDEDAVERGIPIRNMTRL